MDLTGKLLISMPSLEDERFYKTVIYMCAHSSEGAMGIIINPIDLKKYILIKIFDKTDIKET